MSDEEDGVDQELLRALKVLRNHGRSKKDVDNMAVSKAICAAIEEQGKEVEAAIIIGEIAFDNRGFVLAPGADWNKLFGGQKQMETPTSSGKPAKVKWHSSKVSDQWLDGDTIKFKIDTDTMTLGFTIQGKDDVEVRTGWMFKNVLAFTNNKTYPDVLHVFAYIGGSCKNASDPAPFKDVSFTLVETKRTSSVLNLPKPDDVSSM